MKQNLPSFLKTFGFMICVLSSFLAGGKEKDRPAEDRIFRESIHSVRFFREGWEFSMPILELRSDQHLLLRFDDLTENSKNYSYTITHCDFDWFPSRLMPSEYMGGFSENPVYAYRNALNTTIPYVNYSLSLPNENTQILLSGNYLLTIFEEGKRNQPVLTRRFYVLEPSTKISGVVKNATFDSYLGPNQEVDFTIATPGIRLQDPRNEIKVALLQNSRQDNAITNLKPLFIRDNLLIYDYSKENVFAGGNEFRNFDIKNLQTNGYGVENIEFVNPLFHVNLLIDQSRKDKNYSSGDDINGHYLVKNDRASDPELESDYVMVHFTLQTTAPFPNGEVYIFGELSDWKCLPQNKMTYNQTKKSYEGVMLLKQGFYDYQYVYVPKGSEKIDNTLIEGSHVETENDYQILVYYRGFSSRYDKLIGFQSLNASKK